MSFYFDFKNTFIKNLKKTAKHSGVAGVALVMALGIANSASAIPAQYPLFIANPVKPIMMLNMSKDHQLFFKLYDDYSDIIDEGGSLSSSSASSGASSSAVSSAAVTGFSYVKSGSDGIADKTYLHRYRYYGYFDSDKCYTYANGLFSPSRFVNNATRYCNYGGVKNEWSGNLLNWATMTRLDAVRKILYGGKRSIDTENQTVLERAFIPEDAHAFAKYYNGDDINHLTPFTDDGLTMGAETRQSGITFCNATSPSGADRVYSQVVSANSGVAPRLKVARGNFSLWASNEGYQCRWDNGSNDNDPAITQINAYSTSPKRTGSSIASDGPADALGAGNYSVRVSVCETKFIKPTDSEKSQINPTNFPSDSVNEEGCKEYPNGTFKPIGLLQEYGEKGTINFGLMTGSYGKNKSGGVLRKNVGAITDEINSTTGQLTTPANSNTIIGTLNRLTIFGYNYSNGQYNDDSGDDCDWGLGEFSDGDCSNWGNPQSEIYLESLRYLAGKRANSAFVTDDSSRITGLNTADWVSPVTNDNYCAPLNVLQFNASTSSYDFADDQLASASDIGLASLNTSTDAVGTAEGISGNYFVGIASGTETAAEGRELCTPKNVSRLSTVRGTCSDAPRLEGSYKIAGLAYHARTTGITMSGLTNPSIEAKYLTPKVHTYGVALAPAVPKVEVPVPGYSIEAKKNITILPACRSNTTGGNCAIVDFKIINQIHTGNTYTGSLYVNWEDSEQGGDYDQDMWGLIDYTITHTTVKIETKVVAQAAGHVLGFGYVVSGTDNDGFHVQSGINNFSFAYVGSRCTAAAPCTCLADTSAWQGRCDAASAGWKEKDFNVSVTAAEVNSLKQPLYYAAKWGGYANDNATTAAIREGGAPNYYYATDPRQLAASLRSAFNDISERTGSSSGVATNSTSLSESSYLYQAVFNSDNWRGSLNAFAFDANGRLIVRRDSKQNLIPEFSTDTRQPKSIDQRKIYTYLPNANPALRGDMIEFKWNDLTAAQKNHLKLASESDYTAAEKRLNWLRGSAEDEVSATSAGLDKLRSRTTGNKHNVYADIVNSTPVYVGSTNFRYDRLPTIGASYARYVATKAAKTPKVIVGANDGKLHVFNANTLEEKYAYVPNLVFPKLRDLSAQNYGKPSNPHQYLLDGPLTVGDVHIGGSWRTIVVGTLGAGGRGVFALDVTDDTNPRVLFEISDADFPELGYVLGKPIIARMADDSWAVIFGNGDSSGRLSSAVATESRLFVVDIEDPIGGTRIISTGSGRGLSAPAVLLNDIGIAKLVYAGDLNGQMWKFDVSAIDPASWRTSYKLYHARDRNYREQPITAAPTLGINSSKGGAIAVYFGTGKYFDTNDHQVAVGNPTHSLYAVTDSKGGTVTSGLVQKTITNVEINSIDTRTISSPLIGWADLNINGWFLNFGADEERIIAKPLLLADKLVFVTIIPSATSCDYGGASWLLSVPAVGDKFTNFTLLQDLPQATTLTLGALGYALTKTEASILTGDRTGKPNQNMLNPIDETTGRQSWRELD